MSKNHMKNIYFIVNQLYPTAGGLTKSIYDKANFLSQYYNVTILTTNFQLHLESIHNDLIAVGKLSNKVVIKNIFTDLNESNNIGNQTFIHHDYEHLLKVIDSLNTQRLEDRTRVFDKNGLYSHFISYHKNGIIHFIDYMDECDFNILKKRYVFYKEKLLSLDTFQEGKKIQQVIFNKKQQPILNLWHKNNQVNRVFDMRLENIKDTNLNAIVKDWLKTFIKSDDVILIDSEFAKNSAYFADLSCKKIGFIHSHQDYCNDTKFLLHFNELDKFVFLTKLQQEDFKLLNPKLYAKSYLLPHPVHKMVVNPQKKNKIVTISRLVHNKPLEASIKAFAEISVKFPDYIYEIYGNGPESEKLKSLILDLGMQQKIFLKGYTTSPLGLFAESQLSISPTKYEGYGMAILESLGMGCPVITSNVKYGPNELVCNGINGYLVDHNNVNEIVEAIEKILTTPKKYQEKCHDSIWANNFSIWQKQLIDIIEIWK